MGCAFRSSSGSGLPGPLRSTDHAPPLRRVHTFEVSDVVPMDFVSLREHHLRFANISQHCWNDFYAQMAALLERHPQRQPYCKSNTYKTGGMLSTDCKNQSLRDRVDYKFDCRLQSSEFREPDFFL